MSLTALAPSPGLTARAAVGDAQQALSTARTAIAQLAESLWTAPTTLTHDELQSRDELDVDLAALVTGLSHVEAQAGSLRLEVLEAAEQAQTAHREAATGTDAWAASLTGERREVLAGGLRIARLLTEKYHHTREAYAAGHLRLEQVRIIVDTAEQAPAETTPAQLAEAEALLVVKATGLGVGRHGHDAPPLGPRRLRHAARQMLRSIDADLAARHEAAVLGRQERQARNETYLMLCDNGDGTFSGRFTIPELHGHLFRHALDRLTAPRRRRRITAADGSVRETDDASAPIQDHAALNHHELQGLALCELVEHLPTTGHAAPGTTIAIHLDHDALLADLREAGAGTARLDSGATITAGEARRLACEARLLPLVLGGDSQPLDLGRTRRLFSPGQGVALSHRHHTCAIDGCERPFSWCEVHHLHPWSRGGPTDLDQALPLCSWHHHRAHEPDWTLTPPDSPDVGWTLQRLRPRSRRT